MPVVSRSVAESRDARPLGHWSGDALDRARATVDRALKCWCERWGLDGSVDAAANAVEAQAAREVAWIGVPGVASSLAAGAGAAESALDGLLFGTSTRPASGAESIGRDVAAAALAELLDHLGRVATTPARRDVLPMNAPPPSDGARWSGAIVLRLILAGDGRGEPWWLHCGEPVAAVLCGSSTSVVTTTGRTPIVGIAQAIAHRPLRLQVSLAATPVTLGTLQSLRVGDVLPLSHRLDAPLDVAVATSPRDPLCAAYLGRREQSRAVELIALASHSPQDHS